MTETKTPASEKLRRLFGVLHRAEVHLSEEEDLPALLEIIGHAVINFEHPGDEKAFDEAMQAITSHPAGGSASVTPVSSS